MAHSSTGEMDYYYSNKNAKLLNIKPEPTETQVGYRGASLNNNMVAYNQVNTLNQSQLVRIQNSYNIQGADGNTYTIVNQSGTGGQLQQHHNPQQESSQIKYEAVDTIAFSKEERVLAYTPTKNKTKVHNLLGSSASSSSTSIQRKRKPEKAGKGLRHFSMKVCEKVKEKGATTYNEVADELVNEEVASNSHEPGNCDQKNIRRRVYDALNVLMAMQIISKDKKEIRWIGLPSNSLEQSSALEKENAERRERIDQKHQQLRELILQHVALKSLIERNKEAERQGNIPTANSSIQLPFIIVNTHKTTKINCSVTNDKSEYIFKFDDKFEMHDDAEVLKRMGLLCGLDKGQCSLEDIERAKSLVPPNFEKYIVAYGNGEGASFDSDDHDEDDDMATYIETTNDSQSFLRDGLKSPDLDDDEYRNSDID